MSSCGVLVVAGTHGNEVNAPWLLQQWHANPDLINAAGLAVQKVIGNPEALRRRCRYVDRDLNRCFLPEQLEQGAPGLEFQRAGELLRLHGPTGEQPCAVAIDLHSTTAAMGNGLVLYSRRPADLALAAACQSQLGLPIYLHEEDAEQTGFMAQAWPCGLALEVGPVPQGVLCPRICRQSELGLAALLDALEAAAAGRLRLRQPLVIHAHLGSVDFPRDQHGAPAASLHPERLRGDWRPLPSGAPLFSHPDGSTSHFNGHPSGEVHTVFSNEAAYQEKGIAISLTRREVLAPQQSWVDALEQVLGR